MATRPAVPGVIKHQIMYRWFGQWMVTTLYVDHAATPTNDMAVADRAIIHTWLADYWRYAADDRCVARECKSYSLETVPPTRFPRAPWYPTSHVTGALGGPTMPGVTFALSLRTGGATDSPKPPSGRSYYVGGPRMAAWSGDLLLNGGIRDQLEAIFTRLMTVFNDAATVGRFVIVSYWDGGTRHAPNLRADPLVLPVTHVSSSQRLDFQRRRMPRQQAFVTNWSSA